MFNLEQAIADWRRQMLAAGIKTPVPLDELESHLRDDMAQRAQSESSPEQAFEAAVQQIGKAGVLQNEFKKEDETKERKIMKRVIIVSAGVIGILVGMAFVMPAVALYRNEGTMGINDVGLLLLGIGFALGGGSVAVFNLRKRKA